MSSVMRQTSIFHILTLVWLPLSRQCSSDAASEGQRATDVGSYELHNVMKWQIQFEHMF